MMIPPEYEPIYMAGHKAGLSEGLDASTALTQGVDNRLNILLLLVISMGFNVYLLVSGGLS